MYYGKLVYFGYDINVFKIIDKILKPTLSDF